jgi:hypothetical protein
MKKLHTSYFAHIKDPPLNIEKASKVIIDCDPGSDDA